jgi:hypothetical protein
MLLFSDCPSVALHDCEFIGSVGDSIMGGDVESARRWNSVEGLCEWSGGVLAFDGNSTAALEKLTVRNSSLGALVVDGSTLAVKQGQFEGNSAGNDTFPSVRRNILCDGGGALNLDSLMGGDGLLPNTSMWILNRNCTLTGLPTAYLSEFMIPVLLNVSERKPNGKEAKGQAELEFTGAVLVPCADLSFEVLHTTSGDGVGSSVYSFSTFVNESHAVGVVPGEEVALRGSSDGVSIRLRFLGRSTMQVSAAVSFRKPVANQSVPADPPSRDSRSLELILIFALTGLVGIGLLCGGVLLIVLMISLKKQVNRLRDTVCIDPVIDLMGTTDETRLSSPGCPEGSNRRSI